MNSHKVFVAKNYMVLLGIFFAVVIALGIIAEAAFDLPGLGIVGVLLIATLVFMAFEIILRVTDLKQYCIISDMQLQQYIGLVASLSPRVPLPPMRRWAASPDVLVLYTRLINELKPTTIVELGSGVSSIISGYVTEKNNHGQVIALDHDAAWGTITQQNIASHNLGHRSQVRVTSVKGQDYQGNTVQAYDVSPLEDLQSIDLLFVDGPPDKADLGARMPAFLELVDRIADGGAILFDDTIRENYRSNLKSWADSNGFSFEDFPFFEKGAVLLRKKG